MARHIGPRAGSAPYKVIFRIVDLGGIATKDALMHLLGDECQSDAHFNIKVTEVLERYGFVTVSRKGLKLTPLGKAYVAQFEVIPLVEKYVGKIVPPRAAPVRTVLNTKKYGLVIPMREGAFDYRNIPSLMGGKRILPNGEVVE